MVAFAWFLSGYLSVSVRLFNWCYFFAAILIFAPLFCSYLDLSLVCFM